MNRIATAIRGRIQGTRPMKWMSLSLLAASIVLLTLMLVLSYVGQPIGVLLGFGLSVAAFLSYFWCYFHPDAGRRDVMKFLSLVAANVILFILCVLFVFWVPHVQAFGVVIGLFAVVLSYSFWSYSFSRSSCVDLVQKCVDLARQIFKTILVLLALMGFAAILQGLGGLAGMDLLEAVGRDFLELFGGS